MMSLTVLVGTLCLLPSPPLPVPRSSCLSISLHLCRHGEKVWEWQEGGEAEEKEEERGGGRQRRGQTAVCESEFSFRQRPSIYDSRYTLLPFISHPVHAIVPNKTVMETEADKKSQDLIFNYILICFIFQ